MGITKFGHERDKYSQDRIYLPDGNFICFDEDWNKCFDIYFSSTYTKQMSIQDMIYYCLQSADPGIRRILANNVIIAGGGTAAQGFLNKLTEEYNLLINPANTKINISDRMDCKFKEVTNKLTTAWLGGALLSNTSIGEKFYISRKEYEEKGINAILDKYLL